MPGLSGRCHYEHAVAVGHPLPATLLTSASVIVGKEALIERDQSESMLVERLALDEMRNELVGLDGCELVLSLSAYALLESPAAGSAS